MRKTYRLLASAAFILLLLAPLPATAQSFGISFGGRVATFVPCSGGMFHITIIPAGAFPIAYIWTPATITYTVGPPVIPGMQVLGKADFPWVCFIGGGFFSTPIPLYGLRMQMVGTSPPMLSI